MIFSIDGIEYDVIVKSLKRSFTVLDGDNSGRVMNGTMHRDIIGTFYNYNMEIDTKNLNINDYNNLYNTISSPVASHTFILPYNNEMITFKGYISKGSDTVMIRNGIQIWSGLSIDFIANKPQKKG